MGRPKPATLYASEEQIAELILGPNRLRDWKQRVPILERQGMPHIDPLMGGRYLPAVRAFFDRLNGVSDRQVPSRADGSEDWTCKEGRSSSSRRAKRQGSSGGRDKTANVLPIGSRRAKP
jgi:hypothetical protein